MNGKRHHGIVDAIEFGDGETAALQWVTICPAPQRLWWTARLDAITFGPQLAQILVRVRGRVKGGSSVPPWAAQRSGMTATVPVIVLRSTV